MMGIIVILTMIGVLLYWLFAGRQRVGVAVLVCSIGILSGSFLVMKDRVTEITISSVGSIRAAERQAMGDAAAIREIRGQIERQRVSIDSVARLADDVMRITDFSTMILRAKNDDRFAFNQLSVWAKSDTCAFREMAAAAVVSIRAHYSGVGRPGYLRINWHAQPDLSGLSFAEVRGIYVTQQLQYRPSLMMYMWKRQDFSEIEKMELLYDVLKMDQSLTATYHAGKAIADRSGLAWRPFFVEPLLQWCRDEGYSSRE